MSVAAFRHGYRRGVSFTHVGWAGLTSSTGWGCPFHIHKYGTLSSWIDPHFNVYPRIYILVRLVILVNSNGKSMDWALTSWLTSFTGPPISGTHILQVRRYRALVTSKTRK